MATQPQHGPLPVDRRDWPIRMFKTSQMPACGCAVEGAGTIPDPIRIDFCPLHKAAPDLLAECRLFLDVLERIQRGEIHGRRLTRWEEERLPFVRAATQAAEEPHRGH